MGIREYVPGWNWMSRKVISAAESISGIEELEAREMNARFDLSRLAAEKIDADREKKRHLSIVLIGKTCPLDEDALRYVGVDEALVEIGREQRGLIDDLMMKNEKLRARHFAYFAESVCEGVNVRKAPVLVYSGDRIVYVNKKFERKFGSTYGLGVKLRENEGLRVALKRGDGYEVDFERGILVFVGHKKKLGDVHAAHFLSGDNRIKKKIDAFRKKNERAIVDIYAAMRRQGVAFS
jgi:hypothetical protein